MVKKQKGENHEDEQQETTEKVQEETGKLKVNENIREEYKIQEKSSKKMKNVHLGNTEVTGNFCKSSSQQGCC